MSEDLSKALVGSIPEQPDSARPVDPVPATGTEPGSPPHETRPLDWGNAVDAAAARLEEAWVHPDDTGRMLASGLADELAATLCAFGMVAAEVDHMHNRADKQRTGGERTPRTSLD